jgi:hypothetical protein
MKVAMSAVNQLKYLMRSSSNKTRPRWLLFQSKKFRTCSLRKWHARTLFFLFGYVTCFPQKQQNFADLGERPNSPDCGANSAVWLSPSVHASKDLPSIHCIDLRLASFKAAVDLV